jgi:hypothetical protein
MIKITKLEATDEKLIHAFTNFKKEVNLALIFWGYQNGATYWLAQDAEKVVGRISARVCPHIPSHGTVGFFEIDLNAPNKNEVATLLLTEATHWLQEKMITEIIGPIDHNTWFGYRFSLPGKKFFPRFKWEPTTDDFYLEAFRQNGFADFAYYHSVFFPYIKIGPIRIGERGLIKSLAHLEKQGFKMEAFNFAELESKILPYIYNISHEVFVDSLMFEPIDYQTFSHLYSSALKMYDFSPSSFLIAPNGEVAGFIFAFYDGDHLIIKSIGVIKQYQGLKLSSGMVYSAIKQSFPKGMKVAVSALVKTGLASDNVGKRIQKRLWFTWRHQYLLLKKSL